MTNGDDRNVLAVDVRRNRFGYALFEGPARLIDWGASAVSPQLTNRAASVAMRERVASVLRRSHPAMAVVVKRPRRTKTGRTKTLGLALRTILKEAALNRIPVSMITRREIQIAFRAHGTQTKEDIAWVLVGIFPELVSRLPVRRGKWRSESHRMIIFDAIATGVAYMQQIEPQSPPPE